MENRLSELTAAVDSGDLRQALRAANQLLLRVQKQLQGDPAALLQQQLVIKSIKVIILIRQGKTDEALELLRQLPRGDPDLDCYLCIAYKELRNENRLAPCRVACLPVLSLAEAREEVKVLDLFSSLAANQDIFQDVLRLYGSYRKPRYLSWALVTALLSTRHPSGLKRLQLAQQLLRQLPLPCPPKELSPETMREPNVNIQLRDAYAALGVHLSVLRQCGEYEEALELLRTFQNCCLQIGEYPAMRIQLLVEVDFFSFAFNASSNNACACVCSELQTEFLGVYVRLAAAQGEEATANALKKLGSMQGFSAAAAALELLAQRALELVGGHKRLLSERGIEAFWKSVEGLGDPVEGLFRLIEDHGNNYCAFRFFRDYGGRFNRRQRQRLRDLLIQLRPEVLAGAESGNANGAAIRRILTVDKCLLALGEWSNKTADSAQRIAEWRRLFLQHSPNTRNESLAAELICLSVEVFLRWDREAEVSRSKANRQDADPWVDRRFLFEAVAWIDAALHVSGLTHSPLLQQSRCLLGIAVGDAFAVARSFRAMDVKQSFLLSLGAFNSSIHADYGLLNNLGRHCRQMGETREDVMEAYSDYLSAAVEEGSFSLIPQYRFWSLVAQQALDVDLAALQGVLCQVCEPAGRGSAELLMLPAHVSAVLPAAFGSCALAAAACGSACVEWWATAACMNVSPTACSVSFGAFACMTARELGLSAACMEQQEVLAAREAMHPSRRALQLHRQKLKAGHFKEEEEAGSAAAAAAADGKQPAAESAQRNALSKALPDTACMQAAFEEEEQTLFALWKAGLHPNTWQSLWPSALVGGEANHVVSRHLFVRGPPQPAAEGPPSDLFKPWLSQQEEQLLQRLSRAAAATAGEQPAGKRADEAGEASEQQQLQEQQQQQQHEASEAADCESEEKGEESSKLPCSGPHNANRENAAAEGGAPTREETNACKQIVDLLRRSIPGRVRRLRLLFAVVRPSAERRKEHLEAIEGLRAELQQTLEGESAACMRNGCMRSAWPTAAALQTESCGASAFPSGCCRLLSGLFAHQCAALDAFKMAFELTVGAEDAEDSAATKKTAAVANKMCDALDGCRNFILCCCTSVLDTIGALKGLGQPPLAAGSEGIRFSVFDALFGFSQAASVSLLLLSALCQQLRLWHRATTRMNKTEESPFAAVLADARPSLDAFVVSMRGQHKSLVDAMETAGQLEPIGRPPWAGEEEFFSGDALIEEARQRTRTDLCSSYIQTATSICSVLNTQIAAIADCMQTEKRI
ncbi:hypothetical protein Efla_001078 [Eimeria flavescens]